MQGGETAKGTAPLVPPEVDLRDFGFMPLDVQRLRDSDLATIATGEEFKAAVLLWCAAWHQLPAASLPNDERWLARHSGAGAAWRKVRAEALRGFIECSDGRLYHPVVAEKALESWAKKQSQRERTRLATEARRHRNGNRNDPRNGDRNEQRDVDRNDERNVVQGTVKGQGSKPNSETDALPGATTSTPSAAGASPHVRTGQIALQIRALDKSRNKRSAITSQHPKVLEWAKAGVTDTQIREAYDLAASAREADGDAGSINANYLDSFVRKVLNPPPAKANGGSWRDSEEATKAKARELGMGEARPGEDWAPFRARISAEIERRKVTA